MVNRRCKSCSKEKPLEEFYRYSNATSTPFSKCKDCFRRDYWDGQAKKYGGIKKAHRARWLKYQYSLTPEEFDAIKEKQEHLCAVCQIKPKRFYVDHCHKTGVVRGLLCNKCNIAIGQLGDQPVKIRQFLNYLEQL